MHRKKLMKMCLTGALVVSVGVSNASVALASGNTADVTLEKAAEETDETTEATSTTETTETGDNTSDKTEDTETDKEDAGEKNQETGTKTDSTDSAADDTTKETDEKTENKETDKDTNKVADTEANKAAEANSATLAAPLKDDKEAKKVHVNVKFYENGTYVYSGVYDIVEGVHKFTVLNEYVPAGYKITQTGDFFAAEGTSVDVNVEKIQQEVVIKVRFVDTNGTFISGGDYFVPEGTNSYSVLQQYVPEGYKMTVSGDFNTAEKSVTVTVEKIKKDIIMNIIFKDGDEVVGGGDYFVAEGANSFSAIEQYVPEGYVMTVTGDFYAEEGKPLEVSVEKEQKDIIVKVQFKDADGNVVGGGDYWIPAGVNNYSVLEKYLPEGYVLTASGDFYATEDDPVVVQVKKEQEDVIVNIQFKDADGNVIAGGDYNVPAGVNNYSVLQQYAPKGYVIAVTGDFYAEEGKPLEVVVEKEQKDIIVNIQFKDGDEVVGGGDYWVAPGVNSYSDLAKYVPEGYVITLTGDFYAAEGLPVIVSVEKEKKDVVMNIQFKDADGNVIAGGDYSVPAGVNKYSVLEQYAPEGYVITVTGDFYAEKDGKLEVAVEKEKKDVVMNIQFKDADGNVIAGGDYNVPAGVNNYSVLEQYAPKGYVITVTGDFYAKKDGKLEVPVEKEKKDIIVNIQFKDGDEVVAGGDYWVPAGVNSYSALEKYVPEGYVMTVSGDFYAEENVPLIVGVEKEQKDVIMNIVFKDGKKVIGGGDYWVKEGVNNYSALEKYVPEGYVMTVVGDFMAEEGGKLEVSVEKAKKDVIMNIVFKDGDEVVAGGDYTVPAGVNNYSVLEQYVPEGYQMTVTGDFLAEKGGKLEVSIEKIQKDVIMNIVFKDGDEVVAGGDYWVAEGVNKYSALQEYVPEGYQMTITGDFYAEENGKLVVSVEKIQKDVIMNIVFKDGKEVIGGGDYWVPAGVNNYSVLEQYVPEGYQMTVSGDFYAEKDGKLEVSVKKIQKNVIMNIVFKDGNEVVAGGDYWVPAGVNNYSVLEQYLPEGYQMTISGDFYAEKDGKLEVSIEKIQKDIIMNIVFKDGDEVIAGGDYWVPEGVNNYSVLQEYVPEGYQMTVSGDFYAEEGGKLEVNIEKIQKDIIMNIVFKDGEEVIAGGDYWVPEGVNNYSVLEQYLPEGYQMTVSGDFYAEEGGKLEVNIEKIQKDIIMNIVFKDGEEVIAGGDYWVPKGVNNYSVLDKYVPEGYQMTISGDFYAEEGGKLEVNIEKIQKDIIMNIVFKDGEEVIGGGDYWVPEGVNNYSVLEQYVPVGYEMTISGDFLAEEGAHLEVSVKKIQKETALTVTFETVYGEYVGEVYLHTSEGKDGENCTFNLGKDFQLPEGYQLAEGVEQIVDIQIPYGSVGGHTMIVEPIVQSQSETKLTVTFETVYGEVVGSTVLTAEVNPEEGDTHIFSLGTDFQLPEGYQLAEGVDQVTDIQMPAGSVGGHTMLVELIPDEPTDPEQPGDTDEPTNPEQPGDTDEPSNPEQPGDTDEPSNPGQPGDTDEPSNPGQVVDKPQNDKTDDKTETVKTEKKDKDSDKETKKSPKTGDTSNAAAAAAGVMGSLLVLGAAIMRRVRR